MAKVSQTNQLTRQILEYLFNAGHFAFRINTTGIYDTRSGSFRAAPKKGLPDLLCCARGRFIGIELKIGHDQLRPEQVGFLKATEHSSGIFLVVHSFEEFIDKWIDLDIV